MTTIKVPEGSTHSRTNLRKNTVTFFRDIGNGKFEVNNRGVWEAYKDHVRGINPLPQSSLPYEPQVSTFKERVFETIPEPVLRQLVHYYENHDVVEVELNVKMTSVIKG